MGFDQKKYVKEYNEVNYDTLTLRIPKGKREVLKEIAAKSGMSVTQLLITSVERLYHVDLSR